MLSHHKSLTDTHICDILYIRKYGCQGLSQNSLKFEKKVLEIGKERKMKRYTILVDETKTAEELAAEGKYDFFPRLRPDFFPRPIGGKREKREVSLFPCERWRPRKVVEMEMVRVGYRMGTVHELLSLGIAEPVLQMQSPIISLGNVFCLWLSNRGKPTVCSWPGGRSLHLEESSLIFDWPAEAYFIGSRLP
ncbi:hypothetical protein A2996_02620 [Candidatus Campbellbacteria bacterium RIFCSPLOWO2_01_FULL_34_15]|uniref:Uncharacterized protein n=2 Tax=Candidatus Campbelliibacteriota TaxID=1752727 RepID=A0A1F5EPA8_9BACT|nr:MAG: hypothetical protein A2811_00050 [Candidatus Campbellbacteria bacterium RIFCSPHIGHO2_01_FULL_34_10]OGD69205.1 MAG: hypothetical protein A2996_02620 [Candidatus Campbellbacteria bacterium RIFCSPLOWO2_01_FULL_34_15]